MLPFARMAVYVCRTLPDATDVPVAARKDPQMIKFVLALTLLGAPLAAAAQSDQGPPRWAANIVRKQHVIMHGVPRAYAVA